MTKRKGTAENGEDAKSILADIWNPPANWKVQGAWFWWFWLFFIHDENTVKTGKCRQVMILWSIKKDSHIKCNSLDIQLPVQLEKSGKGWKLNGAAAAWYFDGKKMNHDFVLEKTEMALDPQGRRLSAPGKTPSEFFQDGDEFVTSIKTGEHSFEFRAKKTDSHPAVGPTYGSTSLPCGMQVEGTRLEIMGLSGFESGADGAKKKISGTAYFQKILVAAPPPPWYWGLYHFSDGSFFTYMLPYLGRAALADNLWKGARLRSPTLPINPEVIFYHAPSGRQFVSRNLSVKPEKIQGTELWEHEISVKGEGFAITAEAQAYSHSCWKFTKNIGPSHFQSTFKYNEYPATVKLALTLASGEKIRLENGVGNMENAWGFLL